MVLSILEHACIITGLRAQHSVTSMEAFTCTCLAP